MARNIVSIHLIERTAAARTGSERQTRMRALLDWGDVLWRSQ